jgi:hypothetical protein
MNYFEDVIGIHPIKDCLTEQSGIKVETKTINVRRTVRDSALWLFK